MTLSKWVLNTIVLAVGLGLFAPPPAVGQAGSTWTVCSQGCDSRRIQPAIDQASDGDTILIKTPGLYYENLVIHKSLKIKAAPEALPVLIMPDLDKESRSRPTILIESTSPIEVALEDLIIKGGDHPIYQPPAILVKGQARLTGDRVQITEGIFIGLWVYDQAQVVLRDSQIFQHGGGIYLSGSAQAKLIKVAVFNNKISGILASEEGQLSLVNSTVYNNGIGIAATEAAKAVIEGSQIYDHRGSGIKASEASTVEVLSSTVAYNGSDGVNLIDRANLLMKESFVYYNDGWGVAAWLRKCGEQEDRYSGGTVQIDESNVIVKNRQGDVCLP